MIVFESQCLDVVVHAETARPEGIVPCEIDAGKFSACPIGGDCVGLLKGRKQMVGMAFTLILDAKVVDYQDEDDGAPLVSPEPRGDVTLVVAVSAEAFGE